MFLKIIGRREEGGYSVRFAHRFDVGLFIYFFFILFYLFFFCPQFPSSFLSIFFSFFSKGFFEARGTKSIFNCAEEGGGMMISSGEVLLNGGDMGHNLVTNDGQSHTHYIA